MTRKVRNVGSLRATILPISKSKIYDLGIVSRDVTSAQWNSYWGLSSKERLQRILESLLVAYGGAWFAWFVSFMSGGLAPFVGTFLIFNWLYSPWINAKKRNDSFWRSNGKNKRYYALYCGKVNSINKLKRRTSKTIGASKQEFLQLLIIDENGRELEVITQWQEMYRRLKVGIICEGILVSSSPSFMKLEVVTDVYVPGCNIWVGDYPYVAKPEFKAFTQSLRESGVLEDVKRTFNDKPREYVGSSRARGNISSPTAFFDETY